MVRMKHTLKLLGVAVLATISVALATGVAFAGPI
jgi:hypothetical protein